MGFLSQLVLIHGFMKFGFILTEGDSNNYLTYFKRAAVYLAMGRSKTALPDLEKVIELRPDFIKVIAFLKTLV